MGRYDPSGARNISVVSGDSYVGVYAEDGSMNVRLTTDTNPKGVYHKSGAMNVTKVTSGGGFYVAKAVHFDGTAYVGTPTLVSGSHNKLSFALWFRVPSGQGASPVGGFWITDPSAFNFSYGEADPSSAGPGNGGIQFTLIDVDQNTYLASSTINDGSVNPDKDTWYSYMGSADCSINTGPILAYLNDIDASGVTSNLGGPSAVIQGNGVPMQVGIADPGGNKIVEMANFLMWYGSAIDWSDVSNRRKIVDAGGKAVDPALAVSAFGNPTVYLAGDASAFVTNQGTGGAFTLTGSLTNASTSPSG